MFAKAIEREESTGDAAVEIPTWTQAGGLGVGSHCLY